MFLKPSAEELLDELCAHSEFARIEAKASSAIGPSVMQTICAFATSLDWMEVIFYWVFRNKINILL